MTLQVTQARSRRRSLNRALQDRYTSRATSCYPYPHPYILRRFRDIIIQLFSETEKPFRWIMTVKILGRQTFFFKTQSTRS